MFISSRAAQTSTSSFSCSRCGSYSFFLSGWIQISWILLSGLLVCELFSEWSFDHTHVDTPETRWLLPDSRKKMKDVTGTHTLTTWQQSSQPQSILTGRLEPAAPHTSQAVVFMVLSLLTCLVRLLWTLVGFPAECGLFELWGSCQSNPGDNTTVTTSLGGRGPLLLWCDSKRTNHRIWCDFSRISNVKYE